MLKRKWERNHSNNYQAAIPYFNVKQLYRLLLMIPLQMIKMLYKCLLTQAYQFIRVTDHHRLHWHSWNECPCKRKEDRKDLHLILHSTVLRIKRSAHTNAKVARKHID